MKFGYFTRKIYNEVVEVIAKNLQVEDYDLEQLQSNMKKDVTDHYAKM